MTPRRIGACVWSALTKNRAYLSMRDAELARGGYAPLRPCITAYNLAMASIAEPGDLLVDLTRYFIEALPETEAMIRAQAESRWAPDQQQVEKSFANAMKRSAGTNYQTLVTYALARYLVESRSAWYIERPVPTALTEQLAIIFTGNVEPGDADETDAASGAEAVDQSEATDQAEEANQAVEVEDDDQTEPSTTTVKPDIDILLRNEAWTGGSNSGEPLVLLSVKTSLADRAASAARWKTYFDLTTTPCPYASCPGCTYRALGITMANPGAYTITHAIVTANIYKMRFHVASYHQGELHTGQVRSNTHMFKYRYTSRLTGARTPAGWTPFHTLPELLVQISTRHGLPMAGRQPGQPVLFDAGRP